jgi:hypothetical protein
MYTGAPVANFYASNPLQSAILQGYKGLQTGSSQLPSVNYLKKITSVNSAPLNVILLDYLLYYPFIDGDNVEPQILDNLVSLPRSTSGEGVKAFLVSQGSYTGNAYFSINYTNQDGVTGRQSRRCRSNTWGGSSVLVTSGTSGGSMDYFGWHIPLAQGDTGIRSIQSITFESGNGGIYALVLCKDIASFTTREANVPSEKDFILDNNLAMPIVEDGAYLNFIVSSSFPIQSTVFYGSIQTVWG